MSVFKFFKKLLFISPFQEKKSKIQTFVDHVSPKTVEKDYIFSSSNRFNLDEDVVIYIDNNKKNPVRGIIHGRKGDMSSYLVAYGISQETGLYSDAVLRCAHKIGKKRKNLKIKGPEAS